MVSQFLFPSLFCKVSLKYVYWSLNSTLNILWAFFTLNNYFCLAVLFEDSYPHDQKFVLLLGLFCVEIFVVVIIVLLSFQFKNF